MAKQIKRILKNPRFNPDSDTDIARLVSKTQDLPLGRLSEVAQLQAVIENCTSLEDVVNFIRSDAKRASFYTEKTCKKVADASINLQSASLLDEVARRVYKIRCRIVHSKGEEKEPDLLLPFSREAELLRHDIELVEFLASQVLVSSSSPFNFGLNPPSDRVE